MALLLAFPAWAQDSFPTRPIQIINPYQGGGATDLLTRALAAAMAEHFPQPLVVINRDGAAGAVGTAQAARAVPDGHTLLFAPALVVSVLPVTLPTAGYGPDAFRPICQAFSNAQAILVRADSPLRTLADLVAATRATPGGLPYGTLGIASIPHLAMLQWLAAARIEMPHIPYRGDVPVLTDLLAGRLPVGAVVLASASGRTDMRLLAVFDTARNPAFPDIPTAIEQGFPVAPTSFGGLFAPRGTPEPRLAALEAACLIAVRSETYRAAARHALQPDAYFADAATFAARLAQDIAEKAALLRSIRPAE